MWKNWKWENQFLVDVGFLYIIWFRSKFRFSFSVKIFYLKFIHMNHERQLHNSQISCWTSEFWPFWENSFKARHYDIGFDFWIIDLWQRIFLKSVGNFYEKNSVRPIISQMFIIHDENQSTHFFVPSLPVVFKTAREKEKNKQQKTKRQTELRA